MTAQKDVIAKMAEVSIGGAISAAFIPCASALPGARKTIPRRNAVEELHRGPIIERLSFCFPSVTLHRLEITSDWPHGQIATDKLTDPITSECGRATKR